ncbi:MAG TPA: cation:proton antiporter family protein [Patescibacteria group bacterium]|nr:cation:proton antiporter family protein [Patescibacteria group bacterium]
MNHVFLDFTIILVLASFLAVLFRLIKQPPILAYILAGIIIGPLGLVHIQNGDLIKSMAEIGVALLLFILGLELRFDDLKSVGKIAFITGVGQVVFTSAIGFLLMLALGFPPLASVYIAVALTFSSTILIVKLLSDKRDLNSLYGKISVGFLLVQDLFAIIALIILSSLSKTNGSFSAESIAIVFVKGVLLFGIAIVLSKTVFPKILSKLAHSPEALFLFSIAWAFGLSAFVSSSFVGFSVEIGGFLAGLALANSPENFHIISRTRSLRDFFIIIFFVTLGMGMVLNGAVNILPQAILLSIFVLIGNPLIVMVILGLLGFRKRTSFLAGLTVAQVSEFSLILIYLGSRIGQVPENVISLITLVAVITFALSTYMIMNGNALYRMLNKYLDVFERKNIKGEKRIDLGEVKNHIVLAGVNRAGESILSAVARDPDQKIIAIDFNPDVVRKLLEEDKLAVFGDVSDEDILEHVQIKSAKTIISTVSDPEDNLNLIKEVKRSGSQAKIITLARDLRDAEMLYKAGADYVVIPHITSGKHIAKIIKEDKLEELDDLRQKDQKKNLS